MVALSIGNFLGDDDDVGVTSFSEELAVSKWEGYRVLETTKRPLLSFSHVEFNGRVYDSEYFSELIEHRGTIILDDSFECSVGDKMTVFYSYLETGKELYGAFFNTQYRIETWTNNGDLTVMLYHLLKWILLSSRADMENRGINIQTLGGQDFEPLAEYFPELVFRRAMSFECIVENSFDTDFNFIQSLESTGKLEGM